MRRSYPTSKEKNMKILCFLGFHKWHVTGSSRSCTCCSAKQIERHSHALGAAHIWVDV